MKLTLVKVREKGQITLPSDIREALQIRKGTELIAKASGNEIVLMPKIANPVEKAGMLGKDRGFTRVKDLIWEYEKTQWQK
ncbi:AbrB/MazE/SpoVT family DNA-binding domain-containing protein [Candidatus Woesearchaeota archaeon]|nr:AbrB/MazE/SpoVT family DNA-binding domain-containing protein [Candidatus Woesearchaeota archaeon]